MRVNASEHTSITSRFLSHVAKKVLFCFVLLVALIVVSLVSIGIGSMKLSLVDVVKALFRLGADNSQIVILNVRLPRILLAIVSGAALSLSGCVMQSVLRNPMASASTMGISQGAAFGASFAIVVFGAGNMKSMGSDTLSISEPYSVTFCAFAVAMVTTLAIMLIAKHKKATPESMVLAGVALSSLLTGGTTLLQYFATDMQLAAVVYWTFGDLGRASWAELKIIAVVTIVLMLCFYRNRWSYNALDSGENTAKTLGVDIAKLRIWGLTLCALLTATVVSFVGIISFVGLVAPHLVRRIIGNDHRYLLPASAIMGSLLLLISDTVARTILAPVLLPVGAITSFFGAPVFLYLLFWRKKP